MKFNYLLLPCLLICKMSFSQVIPYYVEKANEEEKNNLMNELAQNNVLEKRVYSDSLMTEEVLFEVYRFNSDKQLQYYIPYHNNQVGSRYYYDQRGLLVKEVKFKKDTSEIINELHYSYDEKKRLLKKELFENTEPAIEKAKVLITNYEYFDNNLVSITKDNLIASSRSSKTTFQYDKEGRVTSEINLSGKDTVHDISFWYQNEKPTDSIISKGDYIIYHHFEDGKKIQISTFNQSPRVFLLSIDLYYDEQGRIESKEHYNPRLIMQEEFDYHANGLVKEKREIRYESANPKFTEITVEVLRSEYYEYIYN